MGGSRAAVLSRVSVALPNKKPGYGDGSHAVLYSAAYRDRTLVFHGNPSLDLRESGLFPFSSPAPSCLHLGREALGTSSGSLRYRFMKKKRIAVIGKRNFLFWDNHVVDALTDLGHEILHLQVNNRPLRVALTRGALKALAGRDAAAGFSDPMLADHFKRKLAAFSPDIIFVTSGFFVSPIFYQVFRDLPGRPVIAAWDGDDGAGNGKYSHYVPLIDVLFSTDSSHCRSNPLGFQSIFHLPFCANPSVHRNMNWQRAPKLYFCGAWTSERDRMISSIESMPLVLRGWGWDRLSRPSPAFDIKNGTVPLSEQVLDYNRYCYVLNVHQLANNGNGSLNMRTFEAPACGALLISDHRSEMAEVYEEGSEILTFRCPDELNEILKRLNQGTPDFAQSISLNGYRRTMTDHTYQSRMKQALACL